MKFEPCCEKPEAFSFQLIARNSEISGYNNVGVSSESGVRCSAYSRMTICPEEISIAQIANTFLAFYGVQMFVNFLITAQHWILS
jgi:hypothetical protein